MCSARVKRTISSAVLARVDRDVDPDRLEEVGVLEVLDDRDGPVDAESTRQEGDEQVLLVAVEGGDDDVRLVDVFSSEELGVGTVALEHHRVWKRLGALAGTIRILSISRGL